MEESAKKILDALNSVDKIKSESNLKNLNTEISNYIKNFPEPISLDNYSRKSPEINEYHYGKIVEHLLEQINQNPSIYQEKLIEKIITTNTLTFPMLHELLTILIDNLKKITSNQTLDFIATQIEKIIRSDAIYSAIIDASRPREANIKYEEFIEKWRAFLQILVAIPSKIANKFQGKIRATFTPEIYTKILSYHILRAILFLHSVKIDLKLPLEVHPLPSLVSKLILALGVEKFIDLIDILTQWSLENTNNRREFITKNILEHLERASIEPVAVQLLKLTQVPSKMDKVLGKLVKTPEWRHVLLKKIPLLSYYNSDLLIVNLITYLAASEPKELINLVTKLLDIWGDRSALNHTSLDQHEYITKLILLSIKKTKSNLQSSERETLRQLLFSGTAAHLESLQLEIRAIGMMTSELIVPSLSNSADAPKLTFSYDDIPVKGRVISQRLREFDKKVGEINFSGSPKRDSTNGDEKMRMLGVKCGILSAAESQKHVEELQDIIKNIDSVKIKSAAAQNSSETHDSDDLDSDDDLVPYDMSNDTKIETKLQPTYLRDLKDNIVGFSENKNPEIFSESLKIAEELILSQLPQDDASFAAELLNIFTTLRDTVYVEKFEVLKFKSCVAIVTIHPKECAPILCSNFHAKIGQFSIHDRIFFLNVLAEAARQLSRIPAGSAVKFDDNLSKKNHKRKANKPISLMMDLTGGKKYETLYDDDFEVSTREENECNWQEIVEKRVKLNTRQFAHTTKRPEVTINKFNDVATHFFYPLLYGMSQKGTCLHKIPESHADQEHILLVQFLKTLSTIVVAAENCVIGPKICFDVLELAWTLRYHEQAKIRYCVMEDIAAVIVALSKDNLSQEIIELLIEFRTWLYDVSQDSFRGDPDKNCRDFGKNVVALIDSVIGLTIYNE